MAFDDFQKHCAECEKGRPCGNYHLYAMRLEKSILKKKKFRVENPNYKEGKPCLYVGSTEHVPRCRQSMHQSRRTGTKKDKWTCYCGLYPPRNPYHDFIHNPSKFVKGHTKGLLSPWHFVESNPVKKEKARKKEEELAEDLRAKGYGVWQK